MPKPTNANAPQDAKIYANMPKEREKYAAGFRPSISFAEALAKVPGYAQERMQAIKAKSKSKPFNSNPWTAYTSSTKGKEYDIDGGIIWRAMRHSGAWFLGKHVGANNDFEFWHILDWPKPTATLTTIAGPTASVSPPVPTLVPMTLLPSMSTPSTFVPVLATPPTGPSAIEQAQANLGDDASWEDLADELEKLKPT